jgi:hypothetical protein
LSRMAHPESAKTSTQAAKNTFMGQGNDKIAAASSRTVQVAVDRPLCAA